MLIKSYQHHMPCPTRKFSALVSAQLVISQYSVRWTVHDVPVPEPGGTELGGDMRTAPKRAFLAFNVQIPI